MENVIPDEEYLYRGVVESCWNPQEQRPSSAAFKDSNGVSVDRDGGRNEEKCVEQLLHLKPFYAVCRLTAGNARSCDTVVKHLPVEGNEYHSEIHDSENQKEIKSKSKSRKLAGISELSYRKNNQNKK